MISLGSKGLYSEEEPFRLSLHGLPVQQIDDSLHSFRIGELLVAREVREEGFGDVRVRELLQDRYW